MVHPDTEVHHPCLSIVPLWQRYPWGSGGNHEQEKLAGPVSPRHRAGHLLLSPEGDSYPCLEGLSPSSKRATSAGKQIELGAPRSWDARE